jgi:hypothetical protein
VPKKILAIEANPPRFSYPVKGDVQHLLNMPVRKFPAFAFPIRSDIENTLRDYDVQDHAAPRKLLRARLDQSFLRARTLRRSKLSGRVSAVVQGAQHPRGEYELVEHTL